MFKLYSKGCEYALRALLCVMADRDKKRFSPDISPAIFLAGWFGNVVEQ